MDFSPAIRADHPVLILSDDPGGSESLAQVLSALQDVICSGGGPGAEWFSVRSGDRESGPVDCLRSAAGTASAVVILTEVHNNSCSAEIAAALDQLRGGPVRRKPIGLVAVGAGQSTHAVDHLRVVLAALDAVVIPQSLVVPGGGPGFGAAGPSLRHRIGGFVDELLWYAARLGIDPANDGTVADGAAAGNGSAQGEGQPRDEHSASNRIDGAVSFIRENYTSHGLTLDLAARAAFMSKYHFSRTFKKQLGCRFIDFVTDLRMERASSLLLETNLPVADICDRVGYRDISHFQRTFRTTYATSPSAYRHAAL